MLRATIIAGLLAAATFAGAPPAAHSEQSQQQPCATILPDRATSTPEVLRRARNTADKQAFELFFCRLNKAEYVVGRLYHYGDRRDFFPFVGHLIAEHARLEKAAVAKGKPARGFGAAYWYSLVYGAADFGLRCYATAPGACAGPMDVKHYPLVRDPRKNVTWHVEEMLQGYVRGYRDRGLCEFVFYPAAPRDWGGGRFRRTEAVMLKTLARGQRLNLLGPVETNALLELVATEPRKRKKPVAKAYREGGVTR